jgi:hypothetical protein
MRAALAKTKLVECRQLDFCFHGNAGYFRIQAACVFWQLMKGNAVVTFAFWSGPECFSGPSFQILSTVILLRQATAEGLDRRYSPETEVTAATG